MKNKPFILALVLGVLLPCLMLLIVSRQSPDPGIHQTEPKADAPKVQVLMSDGTVKEMDREEYILGVVLAEMPASFESEALKAQAVVARTFTLRAYLTGGKHGDGSVCTDSTCCQAYRDDLQGEGLQKVTTAVLQTSGQVLLYEGQLIEATYFSCSGGSTEDAVAVWGTDYPYLRATVSPGEEHAAHYTDTVFFSQEEFSAAFGGLSGDAKHWIGFATYTAGGGVHTIIVGGKEY